MKTDKHIVVIIPAFNEENSVGKVVNDIPKDWVREIIVANNNSNDATPINAKNAGAIVVDQPIQGYGNACLKGMEYLVENNIHPDIVVFIDADYSDFPEQLIDLVKPIIEEDIDLVIGSRATGNQEKRSMTPQQKFGNWLATKLIKWIYKVEFTDLGPFRAVKYDSLLKIEMRDKTYGWTVEMQVKAAKLKMKCTEIPVDYRVRIGKSKVSGTVKGTIMAGYKIITTIFKYSRK
ncbi:MAG: glycosyltransferase involved in cell wall biosynthesis [Flavobacteriales bacterium]|jgi:glycosyltransferase involved in cell wall biosynthesis